MLNYKMICIPFILLISSSCFAQSFWGGGTQNTPAQSQSSGSGPNKVMTPAEYNNMVNNLGQQNQNNLMQSAKTQLEKQTPAVQPTPSQTTTVQMPQNNSGVPQMNAPINSQPSAISTPPAQTQPPVAATVTPPPAPTSIIAPTSGSPASSPQNQAYTGFGNFGNTGNTGATTNTNSSNSGSGGWNIRY